MLSRITLLLLILFVVACDRAPDREPEPAIEAETFGVDVERERELLLEADLLFLETSETAGIAEAYRRFLAPDAIQMLSGYPAFYGRDNIYANVAEMAEEREEIDLVWDVDGADVAASGDIGVTWGRYVYTGPNDTGERGTVEGHYVNVWRKNELDQWEVFIDIENRQKYLADELVDDGE